VQITELADAMDISSPEHEDSHGGLPDPLLSVSCFPRLTKELRRKKNNLSIRVDGRSKY
jgi:hypothetical protein